MSPSEVIVLAVEVALRSSAHVVIGDDILLGVVPVVGEDAAVHILGAEQPFRLGRRVLVADLGSLHDETEVFVLKEGVESERRGLAVHISDSYPLPFLVFHELGAS